MIRDERKRKKRKKIKIIVILSFFLVLVLIGFLAIHLFTVKTVEVEGNELYSDEQIAASILNDSYSWNSLYVYLKYKMLKTKEVPFVDTMEVTLENPHKIHINVYEKGLLGYLYIDSIGQNAYFDKDGFVEETSSKIIEGVPKITGISCDHVVLYEKLPLENKKALKTLLSLTQTLKKYELIPDTIDYSANRQITLSYGNVTVMLGNSDNLTEKISRLSYIYQNIAGLNGVLHMENWSEETSDITFVKNE
ncbi:MAG: cell division protein FtsQ/DivIB [Lachnospiraceae bacterium]|nr:cell division protein FtsQ/DivIB [Lachnospiraceae bacterium]